MSEDPKDVARLREALASLPADGTHVVDAERIFDARHGTLSAEERRAVVDELLLDPDAAEAWRLAGELAPPPAAEGAAPAAPWKWLSLAAAAVLVVAMGWQLIGPPQTDEPVYRSVDSRAIASALPPGTVLARSQPVLRWSGLEGARYRVRVLSTELDVLAEAEDLGAPEYTLGDEVLRRIPPGGEILWQVEGRLAGDGVIVSPTFSTRVE